MKFAYDVPGYVQGFRFSQDRRFYDSANARFFDLAGYNRFGNYCEKVNGTASFANHGTNSREGLRLDNTNHWQFTPMVPWEGTHLIVFRPIFASGATMSIHPLIFGNAATVGSNGKIRLQFASGVRSINIDTPSSSLSRSVAGLVSGSIALAAFSLSQSDRKARATQDGVTVSASSALAGTTNGVGVAIGAGGSAGTLGARLCRLGNLSGTEGDVVQNTTDYLDLFEYHTFKGDQLTDNLAAMKEFIDSLKTHYGIA